VKESIIAKRSFEFGIAVIKMTKSLPKSYENIILIKQVIRSSTAIGANIEEALGTNSKKDFAYCMNVAKKEARETAYWLRLLQEVNSDISEQLTRLLRENHEIINMLTKIVKTSGLRT